MRLRSLLETDTLGLRLLGGGEELDRAVTGVMTTDLRDPGRYLSGGELVLTGLAWRRRPGDCEGFVRILARAGAAALAVGEAELGDIPEDLVLACARHGLPLLAVDESVAFATITEHVARQVSGERAGDLAAVVDRHRRLITSGSGGGPTAVLDLLRSDLDLSAWVLSPTGRVVASASPGPALEPAVASRLAAAHLAGIRAGHQGPGRLTVGPATYSLFAVRASETQERETRHSVLSDWLLAVEDDAQEWPGQRRALLEGVTRLIAVERDRLDAARTVRRRLAQDVVDLVRAAAPPAEVAARLRVAAPVLLPGVGAAPQWQIVVARIEWSDDATGPVAAAESVRDGGPLGQALLEEVLPAAPGARALPGDRFAVAHYGGEGIALVPLPGHGGETPGDGLTPQALLAAAGGPLAAGLGDEGRLSLGVSAVVHSAEGLRGALEEARHARRVAAARAERVAAAGHQELASHVLLLPFVPDDVRGAFTSRLLDPLRDYDRRHRAELVPTLEAFLESDGSWTRCAARLHLHVNTLRYRVGRIEQLTGRDLSRLEDKLDFFLALRMS